jgi:mannose-1-phosphate guanylyltransferase/mannose-6-phosphate isomerase
MRKENTIILGQNMHLLDVGIAQLKKSDEGSQAPLVKQRIFSQRELILQAVILCGGSGTRLWPLSREQYPKQLLALMGNETLLQATAHRVDSTFAVKDYQILAPIVVANETYRFVTADQLQQSDVTPAAIVLEPVGRNTAPALTLAAMVAREAKDDPILVVMPSDHSIGNADAFRSAVTTGALHAQAGKIVSFGVTPTRAETGYGYIRAGKSLPMHDGSREIVAFVEKPNAATAARFLATGDYFWNSGIFMIRASVWLEQLSITQPTIVQACEVAFAKHSRDGTFLRVAVDAFSACPANSIDYAVMEKLPSGLGIVIPLEADWSDIGAWDAVWQVHPKDEDNNVVQGDVVTMTTHNVLAISQSRLIAVVGMSDVMIVETADAVLVASKNHMQEVKDLVGQLKRADRTESVTHRKVHRPWGYYDQIDSGNRFQVKRIVVNPGAALSLQMHHHRAEHWIVVRGTARVTRGDDVFLISENESTYIPLGTRHRLENPGKVPLEMIEVQSGTYLGEDDIVRFDDAFGRQ